MSFPLAPFNSPAHGDVESLIELRCKIFMIKSELTRVYITETLTCCFGRKTRENSFSSEGWAMLEGHAFIANIFVSS